MEEMSKRLFDIDDDKENGNIYTGTGYALTCVRSFIRYD